jgi:hypothetical protein
MNNTGLTKLDDFWGAVRPKNHPTSLVFRSPCVNPIKDLAGLLGLDMSEAQYESVLRFDSYCFSEIPI